MISSTLYTLNFHIKSLQRLKSRTEITLFIEKGEKSAKDLRNRQIFFRHCKHFIEISGRHDNNFLLNQF